MSRRANATARGNEWTAIRPWRKLVRANDIGEMIDVVGRYGWLPALVGLALHALARGAFEYLSEPYIVVEGYVFPGWPIALGVNLVFGAAVVAFSWFLYFGLVGAIAGYFSDKHDLAVETFKFGGYLSVLFAPVFLLGAAVIVTITVPEGATAAMGAQTGEEAVEFALSAHSFVYDMPQMHAVRVLKALTWIVTGFLLLPVVQQLYEIGEKQSVLSVLPVTLLGVATAFLF
ncbi:hypothetical protein [Halopiger xanaduensis]|uniref:Yip1 domain-containing protein n=1 Tax=Halopiger xanaduensis (strain DSM 18323 / JCM 14033 / SH-6) TaxID=797210 RepID=F8DCD5_HALXS|nr:hypothetical protein [Halopiger xanaduensis]AEH38394.1 hypothetical protein Halxa_3788 [Halopiger xanaduensis SH-6]